MANEPTYVDAGEDPEDVEDLLPRRARHRRRGGAGGDRRRDRRAGRLVGKPLAARPRPQDDAGRAALRRRLPARRPAAGTTATATCRRSTRRSSRARRSRWARRIGVLGKEGGSGGWSHQHFEIKSLQPSGKWGTRGGLRLPLAGRPGEVPSGRHRRGPAAHPGPGGRPRGPRRQQVVVPRRLCRHSSTGRSRTDRPPPARVSSDPTTSRGPTARSSRSPMPTVISPTTFPAVQILDPGHLDDLPPTIHAAFAPTLGVKAGDPVTFKVRTFRHDRRSRELGLRRWHAAGHGPLGRQRQRARPRRLRDNRPPVRHARRLPGPGRARQPSGREGHGPASCPSRLSSTGITGSSPSRPGTCRPGRRECRRRPHCEWPRPARRSGARTWAGSPRAGRACRG